MPRWILFLICMVVAAGSPALAGLPLEPGSETAAPAGEAHGRRITPRETPRRETVNPGNRNPVPKSRATTGAWTTIGALCLVIAVVVLAARFLKRYAPAAQKTLPAGALQILGKRNIDPRNVVYLLQCGGRILVVGVSPQGLSTLAEITDPAEVEHLTDACRQAETATGVPGFGQLLQSVRGGRSATDEAGLSSDPATQRLRDRLERSANTASSGTMPHLREDIHA